MRSRNDKAPGIWRTAFRNVGRQPRRSVLSATAVGVAAAATVLLLATFAGIEDNLVENIQTFLTGQILVQNRHYERSSVNRLGRFIPDATAVRQDLEALPGVAAASPRIAASAGAFTDEDTVYFPVLGLDFGSDPMARTLVASNEFPKKGSREAVVTRDLAKRLKLSVGQELTAIAQTLRGSTNGISFTVAAIVDPSFSQFVGPFLFIDADTALRFVRLGDAATLILVTTKPEADLGGVQKGVEKVLTTHGLSSEVEARSWRDTSPTLALMGTLQVVYAFLGLIFFCLASTVIVNTMLMVVLERGKEIGTLAALGMDRSRIRNLFLCESAVLSAFGAAAGVVLGSLVAAILSRYGLDYSSAMQGMSLEMSSLIKPRLDWYNPLLVFLASTSIATAFTLLPIRRIASLNIVEALRSER